MSRRWAVIQFPGSNSDWDAFNVFSRLSEVEPLMHWHDDPIEPGQYEVLVIPGGFSFGDYLRAGAIAKLSEALKNLEKSVEAGLHVIGICNGFQILLETKLLPGYLQSNESLAFISRTVDCEVTKEAWPWFNSSDVGRQIRMPIAHRFGNFHAPKFDQSEVNSVLKYIENPNGSMDSTAGIYRRLGKGSVFGLMPHPERASAEALRLADGQLVWNNLLSNLGEVAHAN